MEKYVENMIENNSNEFDTYLLNNHVIQGPWVLRGQK